MSIFVSSFQCFESHIQKVQTDKARAMIIAPFWSTQTWFAQLMIILVECPIIVPRTDQSLISPHQELEHPMSKKLVLIACLVSVRTYRKRGFSDKASSVIMLSCRVTTKHDYQVCIS